ncbi:hypothetical protein TELCIR_03552 [Teladorsagia circumcincta]|uniref:Uncharacterized protein n=1 Tax=Teladorsagia circumcincta TaxID=45464 RepID=A0A2G9UW21_TELCI|nr:hypothetical protein TELCIR_03552 [Teladorsagia circumcincta]
MWHLERTSRTDNTFQFWKRNHQGRCRSRGQRVEGRAFSSEVWQFVNECDKCRASTWILILFALWLYSLFFAFCTAEIIKWSTGRRCYLSVCFTLA